VCVCVCACVCVCVRACMRVCSVHVCVCMNTCARALGGFQLRGVCLYSVVYVVHKYICFMYTSHMCIDTDVVVYIQYI